MATSAMPTLKMALRPNILVHHSAIPDYTYPQSKVETTSVVQESKNDLKMEKKMSRAEMMSDIRWN